MVRCSCRAARGTMHVRMRLSSESDQRMMWGRGTWEGKLKWLLGNLSEDDFQRGHSIIMADWCGWLDRALVPDPSVRGWSREMTEGQGVEVYIIYTAIWIRVKFTFALRQEGFFLSCPMGRLWSCQLDRSCSRTSLIRLGAPAPSWESSLSYWEE